MKNHSHRSKKEKTTEEKIAACDFSLELLNVQVRSQMLGFCADMLSYLATLESIELVTLKKQNNGEVEGIDESNFTNPDITVLQSLYFALASKVNFTNIGFMRYNMLYQQYLDGEIDFSLQPNIDINIGNLLGILSYYYSIKGAAGLFQRDIEQPVFGI